MELKFLKRRTMGKRGVELERRKGGGVLLVQSRRRGGILHGRYFFLAHSLSLFFFLSLFPLFHFDWRG
jgi:hypothetical protein